MIAALPLALLLASPASASTAAARDISTPGGTVAEVAFAIGRQTGVNISLQGGVTRKRIPPIRGRMAPAAALRRLAEASGMELRRIGPRSFIMAPRPVPRRIVAPVKARATIPPPPRPAPPPPRSPPEAEPQEVVVTASRRDTLARRFPGQWTRIDGSDLAVQGVVGTDAIGTRTVGFSSTHLGAGRNKLFVRGIADSSFSGPTQSPVGQYLGDLRTGYSGPDPDLRLVDMHSVEILEGPQGTLYGAGALGGIILLKPNLPVLERSGGQASTGASLTQHGAPGHDLGATLNLPLGQSAALRLTGYRTDEGGYVDNRRTGKNDINRLSVTGGRLIGTVALAPSWSVDLTATAQRIAGRDSQYSDREEDGLSRSSAFALPFRSDFALAGLVVRKDEGPLKIHSTTGATRQEVSEHFDLSSAGKERRLEQVSRARSVSSESRVWRRMRGGLSWLAGASLLHHRYIVARVLEEGATVRSLGKVENQVTEVTLHGEVGVELTRRLEASAGARYTVTNLRGFGQHLPLLAFDQRSAFDPDRTERRLLPSASLLARPVDGIAIYGRYQEGFRPGGLSIANDLMRHYERDLLRTAEVGFRFGKPRRDRLDLSGSLMRSDWNDIQADFLDQSGLPVTDNIGDGRIWSATLNGGLALAGEWRLEAGVAWNDGRIVKLSEGLRSVLFLSDAAAQMRIPNIARVVARAAIDFRRDLGFDRSLEMNLYTRYVGTSRLGIGPRLGERQGDYFDSGLLARLSSGSRTAILALTNLLDQVGNRFAFGAPTASGGDQLTPLRPRTVRLGLEWAF